MNEATPVDPLVAARGNDAAALRCSGVTVSVGSAVLLSDVSVAAHPGEVVALIGPNGAGKSTLLAALAGDMKLAAGRVYVGQEDVARCPAGELARRRAVMLQDTAVAFGFLVRDVVEMGRRPWAGSCDPEENARVVDEALRVMDLAHLAARDVTTLSGGERARTALARVLAQKAPVVMLDEPTAAMDVRHQEQALGVVRAMADSGVAVIVVLHDLSAAARCADHVVCLASGCVVADGSVEEVYRPEVLSRAYGWPIEVMRVQDASGKSRVVVMPGEASVGGGVSADGWEVQA